MPVEGKKESASVGGQHNPRDSQVGSRFLLIAIMIAGASLRLFDLENRQLWLDELIQLQRFSGADLWANVLALRYEIGAVPLDYTVQSFFVNWLGPEEFGARFHAALFGALTLPLAYMLARPLSGRRTALIAAACLSVYPLHWEYSREGRNYALFTLLTVASYLSLLRACNGSRRWWPAYALATALSLYANMLGLVTLACQGGLVWMLSRSPEAPGAETGRAQLKYFLWSAGLGFAVFLPWLAYRVQPFSDSSNPLELWLPLRIFKELGGNSYFLAGWLALLAAVGIRELSKTRRRTELSLILWWGGASILIVIGLAWIRGYILAIRHLLFATPALLLAASVGIDALPRSLPSFKGKRAPIVALAVTLALSLGTIGLKSAREPQDWRGAAEYLAPRLDPATILLAPNTERPLAFRLNLPLDAFSRLETLPSGDPSGQGRCVLVESAYMTPAQAQLARELASPDRLIETVDFEGLTIRWLHCRKPK